MIRFAQPADHAAIDAVTTAAFGRSDEARLTAQLRADGDAMFEMVAQDDGRIVGHIMFSRLWADRDGLYAALAPLSVLPALQRRGVGASLVQTGLASAPQFGAAGVLVLGEPAYYSRFGFAAETAAQVDAPYRGMPAFMGLGFVEGAFEGPMTVAYPSAFSA
ncbi:N-acetyltransferase [Phenylobacterium sp.]|uniref:GNAT family N-acetyltransferase n=1 Tax=Phenylobacterium sp. TaxID=1871053 RepID=UPI002DF41CB2|nr:N-acetyltransferase [Phenylobacterium sp.]